MMTDVKTTLHDKKNGARRGAPLNRSKQLLYAFFLSSTSSIMPYSLASEAIIQ
jgi:hypothetical protein